MPSRTCTVLARLGIVLRNGPAMYVQASKHDTTGQLRFPARPDAVRLAEAK
ncbi:hypothetical protein [Streptomyces longhuiensis]|uniref:hypothetical protein n=1 Tax=Streptomyces longhuiensis TaxID=2880933 RepID=UPI001D09DFFC|nr:hypothetical protein [Streptomyces longhuiensis]UDL97599.1 hypothetical protein LGI35_04660 [Streptomyces longhuiensis]